MINALWSACAKKRKGTVSGIALDHLRGMINDINNDETKDLRYWRMQDPGIINAFEDFCKEEYNDGHDGKDSLMKETQHFFDDLNRLMDAQERSVRFFPEQKRIEREANHGSEKEVVSIVLGGKKAVTAQSISEKLVDKLAKTCKHVYTVSRSGSEALDPVTNITHIQSQDLMEGTEASVKCFVDIINKSIDEQFSPQSSDNKQGDNNVENKMLVMYFTLGCYLGKESFQRNIRAAKSFSEALMQTFSSKNAHIEWKVVITGTDAIFPSTHPVTIMEWEEHTLKVPTWKIAEDNYVYAMSKLGQFYTLANAISTIHNIESDAIDLVDIVERITQHINAAGDVMEYNPNQDNILPMSELDKISKSWTDTVQPALESHLTVANGLSILYTPLHLHFVDEAIDECKENDKYGGSIKAHIMHQLVFFMQNAVSIGFGANSHVKFYGVGCGCLSWRDWIEA